MGLSMYERQVLSAIEHELRREDPRFAAYMDQLAPTDRQPDTVHLWRAAWRHRKQTILAVAGILIGLVLGIVFLATTLGSPGCAKCGANRGTYGMRPASALDTGAVPGRAWERIGSAGGG